MGNLVVTTELFHALLQCPRKACLSQIGYENSKCNYCSMLMDKKQQIFDTSIQSQSFFAQYGGELNKIFRFNGLEAVADIWHESKESIFPVIFIGTVKIDKYDELKLGYIGHVASLAKNKIIRYGHIVNSEGAIFKFWIHRKTTRISTLIEKARELLLNCTVGTMPQVILSRKCSCCIFVNHCSLAAKEKDSLWQLSQMNWKTVKKLEKKGVTTLDQLSYQYRARRRKKKRNPKAKLVYQPALHALAIKEKRVYAQTLPERIPVESCLVIDIEGDPDRDLHYLIGVLSIENGNREYVSFWSDSDKHVKKMWKSFIEYANNKPDSPIYHYGSYDRSAIRSICGTLGKSAANVLNRLVNINSKIHGLIYFPTFSNSLKEIGAYSLALSMGE